MTEEQEQLELDPKTEEQKDQTEDKVETQEELVSKKVYKRVEADLMKAKAEAKKLAQELEQRHKQSLREKEDYKTLAHEYETKYKEESEKNQALVQAQIHEKRYAAVERAALQAGIREDAITDLELLNLNEVEVEVTSTGRMIVNGAEDFVARLKAKKPHWFGRKGVSVNTDTPDVRKQKAPKWEDVIKLREKASKTRSKDDWSAYKDAEKEWLTSNQ